MATATFNKAVTSPLAGGAGQAITHLTIQDAASGGASIIYGKRALTLEALDSGESYTFAADTIVITQAPGVGGTAAGAKGLLEALVHNTDLHIRQHTADPGTDPDANEATYADYGATELAMGAANWDTAE